MAFIMKRILSRLTFRTAIIMLIVLTLIRSCSLMFQSLLSGLIVGSQNVSSVKNWENSIRYHNQVRSNDIEANDNLPKFKSTVVTAYFSIPSKRTDEFYKEHMESMLQIHDAMVIFTQPDMVDFIEKQRKHILERTIIIPIPDFARDVSIIPFTNNEEDFWRHQHRKHSSSSNNLTEDSWKLYKLWLSKIWFIMKAVEIDYFQSSVFVWCDIGNFRVKNENWKGRHMVSTLITNIILSQSRILFQATKDYYVKPRIPENAPWILPHQSYISASIIAGEKESWKAFHQALFTTIDGFRKRDLPFIDDQSMYLSTCLHNPQLCAFVKYDETILNEYKSEDHPMDDESLFEGKSIWWKFKGGKKLNHYGHAFAVFKYVLYHGGPFDLWWPGKDGEPEYIPLIQTD